MMLNTLILMAMTLLIAQIATISSVQPTSVTNIFHPYGTIIYNHGYETLKINKHMISLYVESLKVYRNRRHIRVYIKLQATKLRLSRPNYSLIKF